MPTAKDKMQTTDNAVAEVTSEPKGTWFYKCPKCGSGMKEDQQVGFLICASGLCRERVEKSKIEKTFQVDVRHPCPKCGKETKDHHGGTRICSHGNCRHVHIHKPKQDLSQN